MNKFEIVKTVEIEVIYGLSFEKMKEQSNLDFDGFDGGGILGDRELQSHYGHYNPNVFASTNQSALIEGALYHGAVDDPYRRQSGKELKKQFRIHILSTKNEVSDADFQKELEMKKWEALSIEKFLAFGQQHTGELKGRALISPSNPYETSLYYHYAMLVYTKDGSRFSFPGNYLLTVRRRKNEHENWEEFHFLACEEI